MRHFKSPSMKQTMVLTNNKMFWLLDKGPVPKKLKKGLQPTTKRYRDAAGRKRFVGTSRLKKSQPLDLLFRAQV